MTTTPEAQARLTQSRRDAIFSQWNAPRRHVEAHANLKPNPKWEAKRDLIISKLGTGFLFGLCGTRGPGKTQMAVEVMFKLAEKFKLARYTTAVGFFLDIKATFGEFSGKSAESICEGMRTCDLLVIDEIGKRGQTAWENNLLFEILNYRYNEKRDTILIDNSTAADFSEAIGDSLVSRMNEIGGVIVCDWPSFRV